LISLAVGTAIVLAVLTWAAYGREGAPVVSYLRGQVRVWVVPYRAHDGKTRLIYLDLPRWYGPARRPLIPLVISPHGRQARAQANSALWGQLPAQGGFAVANPEGQGRVLQDESWGYWGQIADLARMPVVLGRALPWLRINRRRVYAVGGSMGGQEALLLLARFPRLLAGVVTFDAPTSLAQRYYALTRLRSGHYLQGLMRQELGATPAAAPGLYEQRSPTRFAAQIAFSHVPVELWWSRKDGVVVNQSTQSGLLYRLIKKRDPQAPIREVVGTWPHMAEMSARRGLPTALRRLGLLPSALVRGRFETSLDASGTFLFGGQRVFPIALTNPPPLYGTTPTGLSGQGEVARVGVNVFRVGPSWSPWTLAEVARARRWDRAAARLGIHTWINLNGLARARPRLRVAATLGDTVLALLTGPSSRAIALWKGADEPGVRHVRPASLEFAYCRVTSRGNPSWCAGQRPLDRHHLWVTIQAPSGTAAGLAAYSKVTDTHGVDVYPVTFDGNGEGLPDPAPDLHAVGIWTRRLAWITPDHSVWVTLEICAHSSYSRKTGQYLLPTAWQERYMVYDAVINGARGLSFFGGDNPHCWNRRDRAHGWNWTFWNSTLRGLITQIGARSPLAPALVDPASTRHLSTNDPATEAISRTVTTSAGHEELWLIVARHGVGSRTVTITGLPTTTAGGTVYTEGRPIGVRRGTLTDRFRQWQVHVYRFRIETPPARA
jgi:pimeloyl-ACP methyl ester carboxylesterase